MSNGHEEFKEVLDQVLSDVRTMLIDKNRKYGNSVIEPRRIFSRASPLEQINVRIDDKLSRMSNQQADDDEDVANDLLGYLVIREIAKRIQEKNKTVALCNGSANGWPYTEAVITNSVHGLAQQNV